MVRQHWEVDSNKMDANTLVNNPELAQMLLDAFTQDPSFQIRLRETLARGIEGVSNNLKRADVKELLTSVMFSEDTKRDFAAAGSNIRNALDKKAEVIANSRVDLFDEREIAATRDAQIEINKSLESSKDDINRQTGSFKKSFSQQIKSLDGYLDFSQTLTAFSTSLQNQLAGFSYGLENEDILGHLFEKINMEFKFESSKIIEGVLWGFSDLSDRINHSIQSFDILNNKIDAFIDNTLGANKTALDGGYDDPKSADYSEFKNPVIELGQDTREYLKGIIGNLKLGSIEANTEKDTGIFSKGLGSGFNRLVKKGLFSAVAGGLAGGSASLLAGMGLTAGGIIAGGLALMAFDGLRGYFKSDEWGVDKVSATIGAALGGTGGSGGLDWIAGVGKVLAGGTIGAKIGGLIGGPIGLIIGALVGTSIMGLLQWVGGQKIATTLAKLFGVDIKQEEREADINQRISRQKLTTGIQSLDAQSEDISSGSAVAATYTDEEKDIITQDRERMRKINQASAGRDFTLEEQQDIQSITDRLFPTYTKADIESEPDLTKQKGMESQNRWRDKLEAEFRFKSLRAMAAEMENDLLHQPGAFINEKLFKGALEGGRILTGSKADYDNLGRIYKQMNQLNQEYNIRPEEQFSLSDISRTKDRFRTFEGTPAQEEKFNIPNALLRALNPIGSVSNVVRNMVEKQLNGVEQISHDDGEEQFTKNTTVFTDDRLIKFAQDDAVALGSKTGFYLKEGKDILFQLQTLNKSIENMDGNVTQKLQSALAKVSETITQSVGSANSNNSKNDSLIGSSLAVPNSDIRKPSQYDYRGRMWEAIRGYA